MGDQPGDVAAGVQLVHQVLGPGDVDVGVHQRRVDVVHAHPAVGRVLEATEGVERARPAGRLGGGDVLEPGGGQLGGDPVGVADRRPAGWSPWSP